MSQTPGAALTANTKAAQPAHDCPGWWGFLFHLGSHAGRQHMTRVVGAGGDMTGRGLRGERGQQAGALWRPS
jgi:hypothetical protein